MGALLRVGMPRSGPLFVITLLLALLQMRHGTALGPDAWAYWSASLALLDGRGYVDAFDLPIVAWPPLYSLWLAGSAAVLGPTIAAANAADCLAAAWAATAAAAWLRRRVVAVPGWLVDVFVVANVLLALRGIGSELLMLAASFSALLALEALPSRRSALGVASAIAAASGCLVLAVLTRHAALAFVPAAMALLVMQQASSRVRRAVAAAALLGSALVAWWCVRTLCGQAGSHPFFTSQRDPLATAWTMLRGIDRVIAPFPLGMLGFAVVLSALGASARGPLRGWRSHTALANRDCGPFLVVAFAATWAMFQLVSVADAPGERFVRVLGLVAGGLLLGLVGELRAAALRWLLLALIVLPHAVAAAKWIALGRRGRNQVSLELGGEAFLPPHATLRRGAAPGLAPDGALVVEMPKFAWLAERLRALPVPTK